MDRIIELKLDGLHNKFEWKSEKRENFKGD